MQPLQLQLGPSNVIIYFLICIFYNQIPYSQHYDYYQMFTNDTLTSDLYNSAEVLFLLVYIKQDEDDAIRTRNLIIKIGEFLRIKY